MKTIKIVNSFNIGRIDCLAESGMLYVKETGALYREITFTPMNAKEEWFLFEGFSLLATFQKDPTLYQKFKNLSKEFEILRQIAIVGYDENNEDVIFRFVAGNINIGEEIKKQLDANQYQKITICTEKKNEFTNKHMDCYEVYRYTIKK